MWWIIFNCFHVLMLSWAHPSSILLGQSGHIRPQEEQVGEHRKVPQSNEGDSCGSHIDYNEDGTASVNVRYDKPHVDQDDAYMCTAYEVPFNGSESFITKFMPYASMNSVHHLIMYGCNKPGRLDKKMWKCSTANQMCEGSPMLTMYAWARDAPPLTLPPQVGFRIGGSSGIKYLIVQIHFAKKFLPGQVDCSGVAMVATQQKLKFHAGVLITGTDYINIPPFSRYTKSDTTCTNPSTSMVEVFAFRTHAHSLGTVMTAYRVRNGNAVMIGKGNPQWPQAFYPRIGGPIDLLPRDGLVFRCVYKSDRPGITRLGFTDSDEMCNMFLMYYTANPFKRQLLCWGNHLPSPSQLFPPTTDDLAPYPGYAGQASTVAIATGAAVRPEVPKIPHSIHRRRSPPLRLTPHPISGMLVEEMMISDDLNPELVADLRWPEKPLSPDIGQVGGVAVDGRGDLHIFHRADRKWGPGTFLPSNILSLPHRPITGPTVVVIGPQDGAVIHSWGGGVFYMPHGATVDQYDTLWLTDVGMHQVFRFPLYGGETPLLTLGVKMEPGSDNKHFCKPTDVAVDEEGAVYVSDGYCNGRIMKFHPDGRFIRSWGERGSGKSPPPPFHFDIVHSIAITGPDEVCAADRENGRVQCFTLKGAFRRVIEHPHQMGENVYAIAYSASYGGVIYAVNGPSLLDPKTSGFTLRCDTGAIEGRWSPSPGVPLTRPHDVAVSQDGKQVYVGQLSGRKIYKFDVINSGNPLL